MGLQRVGHNLATKQQQHLDRQVHLQRHRYIDTYIDVNISIDRNIDIYLYIYIYIDNINIFSIHLPIDGHLHCFHILAIANTATMNTEVKIAFQISVFVFFR